MNFTENIQQLLVQEGKITVPGFGLFYLQNSPAALVADDNVLRPPSRQIGFEADYTAQDTTLLAYLQQQGQSFPQAEETITSAVSYWKKMLQDNQELRLPALGTFYPDREMQFHGETVVQHIPELYGLENIKIENLSRSATSTVQKRKKPFYSKPLFWILLLGIPAGIAGAAWYYGPQTIFGTASDLTDPRPQKTTAIQKPAALPADTLVKKDSLLQDSVSTKAFAPATGAAAAATSGIAAKKWKPATKNYSTKKYKKYPKKTWRKSKRQANRSR